MAGVRKVRGGNPRAGSIPRSRATSRARHGVGLPSPPTAASHPTQRGRRGLPSSCFSIPCQCLPLAKPNSTPVGNGLGPQLTETSPRYTEQSRRKERNRLESREANTFLGNWELGAERRERNGEVARPGCKIQPVSSCFATSTSPESSGGGILTLCYSSQVIPNKN